MADHPRPALLPEPPSEVATSTERGSVTRSNMASPTRVELFQRATITDAPRPVNQIKTQFHYSTASAAGLKMIFINIFGISPGMNAKLFINR